MVFSYQNVLDYFEELEWFRGMDLGLETIKVLLERLGNPQEKYKTIHIGGTNGKGSTTAMCSAVLKEAGFKVGTYTSPHLTEITERIAIDGRQISKRDFVKYFSKVKKAVDELEKEGIKITWFEFMTAIAFLYFAKRKVDYAVLEVGLGGRLDATNVISTPAVAIITNIGLDHTHILGNSILKIAKEKAGIIKKDGIVVTTATKPKVLDLFDKIARKKNAKLINAGEFKTKIFKNNLLNQTIVIETKKDEYKIKTKLLGDYQRYNALATVSAMEVLGIKKRFIISGLAKAKWNGRMEIMQQQPLVILDCAHNTHGIRELVKSLTSFRYHKLILVLGIASNKNIPKMTEILTSHADFTIITQAKYRGADPTVLKRYVKSKKIEIEKDVLAATQRAINIAQADDLVLVAGSIFTVGEARTFWYPSEKRFLT